MMLGRCSMGTDDGRAGQLSNAAHRPPRQPKIMLHFSRENAERMKILSYQRRFPREERGSPGSRYNERLRSDRIAF